MHRHPAVGLVLVFGLAMTAIICVTGITYLAVLGKEPSGGLSAVAGTATAHMMVILEKIFRLHNGENKPTPRTRKPRALPSEALEEQQDG